MKMQWSVLFLCGSLFLVNCHRSNRVEHYSRSIVVQTSNLGVLPWLPEASIDSQLAFSSAVFGFLLSYDEDMSLLPGLFSDYNWNASTSSYHFKYDPTLRYHDGEKIQPEDIEFAIAKLFLTEKKIVRRPIFGNIVGVDKLQVGQKFFPGIVSGITYDKIGNFYIKLKKSNPQFLYSLANSVPPISPRKSFKNDLFSYRRFPVGLGPYRVVRFDEKRVIVDIEKVDKSQCNPDNPCPVRIKFIETGDPLDNKPDIAAFTSARSFFDNDRYTILVSSLPTSILNLDFNFKNEFAKKVEFRKAISLAIERIEICRDYKKFRPSHQLITSRSLGSTVEKFEFDPVAAKKIIEASFGDVELEGWFHGPKGLRNPDYVETVRKQLLKIGVKVNFSPTMEHGLGPENVGIFVYAMGLDYSDPLLPLGINLESPHRKAHLPADISQIKGLFEEVKAYDGANKVATGVRRILNMMKKGYIQIPIAQGYKVVALSNRLHYKPTRGLAYTIDFTKVLLR